MDDRELTRQRIRFGFVFQQAALFDSMTVAQNIAFPLRQHTEKRESEIQEIVMNRLAEVGLPEIAAQKKPAELSGGMRKRVGLARALILEPQILLYDEPTTGLDPVATKNVDDMIRDISKETGVTSVVISHDMASTFRIADRISMLYDGKIAISAKPDEFKQSQLPFVREFVEMSGTVTFEKHYELPGDDDETRPGNT
jgi:phospholipid/cholesterol/gamma-HCH transport system ATP-binding protein